MNDLDVEKDIELLVSHFRRIAGPSKSLTFGQLFNDHEVEQTFESLVGTLKAARRAGSLNFEGETLLMPTHQLVRISLSETPIQHVKNQQPKQQMSRETPYLGIKSKGTQNQPSNRIQEHLLEQRRKFEKERDEFEQKMFAQWNNNEINSYFEAKLKVEMDFLKKYSKDPSAGTNKAVVKSVRAIMNEVFAILKAKFVPSTTYKTGSILDIIKSVIVETTMNSKSENLSLVKQILNQLFHSLKEKFVLGNYISDEILEVVKKTIVDTTNELLKEQIPTKSREGGEVISESIQSKAHNKIENRPQSVETKEIKINRNTDYLAPRKFKKTDSIKDFSQSLSLEVVKEMREIFKMVDKDDDGAISIMELDQVLNELDIKHTKKELEVLFSQLDNDNSGLVDFNEFIKGMKWIGKSSDLVASTGKKSSVSNFIASMSEAKLNHVKSLFREIDKDNDGFISRIELQSMMKELGVVTTPKEFLKLFELLDTNGDGQIEFKEFVGGLRWLHTGFQMDELESQSPTPTTSENEHKKVPENRSKKITTPTSNPLHSSDGQPLDEDNSKVRKDALTRIKGNPDSREVDLRDPDILETYLRVRDLNHSLLWMILGYTDKRKLKVVDSGTTDFKDFVEHVDEDKPFFAYIDYRFGDTGRSKFIFITYVPEFLGGLEKSRVVGHRPDVEHFIKYKHITWNILSIDELKETELKKMLLKAGGANYSVQEDNKGDFSSYKMKTKTFYEQKDKETQVKAVYSEGPLLTTPCDISGRATVASATDFLSNTSKFFKGKT